jgi:hypothetical protein
VAEQSVAHLNTFEALNEQIQRSIANLKQSVAVGEKSSAKSTKRGTAKKATKNKK